MRTPRLFEILENWMPGNASMGSPVSDHAFVGTTFRIASLHRCVRLARIGVLFFVGTALASAGMAQNAAAGVSNVAELLKAEKYSEALDASGKLLKSDPSSPALWTLRAVAQERTNHIPEALASYKHALKLVPDYLPALEGAAQIEYKRNPNDARSDLRRIVAIQPQNATAHAMLGVLEYRSHDYAACADSFHASGDMVRAQPTALMANALCLAHLDRGAEAVPLLQEFLAQRPENAAARFDLALLQWKASAPEAALQTLEPLLNQKPVSTPGLRLAAAIRESQNETPKAIELLRSAILTNPDEAANYIDFATLCFAHGSYKVGIDMVNVGLQRLPKSAPLYMARGVLFGQNGEFEKAMEDFERAHMLDPGDTMVASAEGIAQSQQHNYDKAIAAFRRQVREHPGNAFGYYLLAEALAWSGPEGAKTDSQNQIAEAITVARKAKELDPKLIQASELLGSLYLQNGQFELAIQESRAVMSYEPSNQQAIYTLMLALKKQGHKEEAREMVEKLTNARKAEQAENSRTMRYGQLVEQTE